MLCILLNSLKTNWVK